MVKYMLNPALQHRLLAWGGGVTDTDYRGAVSIIYFNHSSKYVGIEKGERFCQIVFQKIAHSANLVEAEDIGNTPSVPQKNGQTFSFRQNG